MTSDGEDRRATQEATDWLIALREEPDDAALRARFDVWRAASPINGAAWMETCRVYDLIGETKPAVRPAVLSGHGEARGRPFTPCARRSRRLAAAGAIAALAACLMLVFGPGVLLRLQASHVTSTAEIRAQSLEDGSVVQLGPESAIEVAFEPAMRRVRLLKGEAFFSVVPDSSRPFVVHSGDVRTTVAGTSFEVRQVGEATDIAVREGIVQVASERSVPSVAMRLAGGDRVRIDGEGRAMRSRGSVDEMAAWLQGRIVAHDRAVGEVIDELRRYHRGAIVMADGDLARERVTGIYNVGDPLAALRAVASAHGATAREIGPWLIVISRDKADKNRT